MTGALIPHAPKPDLFTAIWRLWQASGKPLGDRDKEMTLRLWLNYEEEEHLTICRWAVAQFQSEWPEPRFTPLPQNALRSQGWRRVAMPRLLPASNGKKKTVTEQVADLIEAELRNK